MLKQATYGQGIGLRGKSPVYYRVAYVIIKDRCYFSGITRGPCTIHKADEVIEAITEQEDVDFAGLRYFDIRTYKGSAKLPGQYEVDELEYEICREPTEDEFREQVEEAFGGRIKVTIVDGREPEDEYGFFPQVIARHKTLLSADVLALFKEHIGKDP